MGANRARTLGAVPMVLLLACTTGAPSSAPRSGDAPEASPTVSSAAAAGASAGVTATAPSSPRTARPSLAPNTACADLPRTSAFEAASRAAMDELILAIGNPDVDSKSEASAAFDEALMGGDPARITATAEVVLAHLARSRDALAPFADCRPSVVGLAEWEALVGGLEAAVTAMRDAGTAGSPSEVEAGRTRYVNALQDHFWQAVRGQAEVESTMAWPDGRTIRASRARFSQPVNQAFDGRDDSMWSAGDAPAPQWIEVDYGRAVSIAGIRLLTAQDAPAETDHEVTVLGATGDPVVFTRFTGSTSDRQWLEYRAPTTVPDVRSVRVTTLESGTTIGWREIDIGLGVDSAPRACSPGTTNLALGRPVTASGAAPDSPPEQAVDGKSGTAWRAVGPAPQRIEVDLGADVEVSEVRLLVAQSAPGTTVHVVNARDGLGHSMNLRVVSGETSDGQWLSVAGPTPCVGLRWISVETGGSQGPVAWYEIEVLGTPKP